MNIYFKTSLAALAASVAFYGCKSSEPTGAGGAGGESGKPSTSGGKGGSSAGGASGKGGSAGKGGSSSGGAAGKAGSTSEAAGESNAAGGAADGSGGSSASGTGGTSNTAGEAGSGEPGSPEDRGYLLGPETDDQAAITVTLAHSGFAIDPALFLTDSDGNFFITDGSKLDKYGPSLEPVWSFPLNSITGVQYIVLTSLTVAPDGGLFFGAVTQVALDGETFGGGATDAVVGKLTSDGMLDWAHQLGASGGESTALTAPTSDGAVIAAGDASGQLPGMPSTVAGGPWLARFEADGTRTFLEQYAPWKLSGGNNYGELVIDATGKIVLVGFASIFVADSDGAELARYGSSVPGDAIPGGTLVPLALDSTKTALFSWASPGVLTQRDLTGTPVWFRNAEPERTAVIDSVENVIWTGGISTVAATQGVLAQAIAVGTDAVYLVGVYTNKYKNGSTTRPATTPLFVGRYDLDGDRVWFQELSFEDFSTADALQNFRGIVLDDDENPVIAERGHSVSTGFIVKLDKEDGSLL